MRQIPWKTPVEPVKCTPASSGLASAASPTAAPGPYTRLITPGGSPACSSSFSVYQAGSIAVEAGFQTTVQPVEGRRRRQVRADRGEVERADRQHEPLERPVLEPVPDAGRGDRLLLVDSPQEAGVEAPEVAGLAGRVDLGLVGGLRQVQHRRRVQRVPPRPREQLRGAQEDGDALLPRGAAPVAPRLPRRRDRRLHLAPARPGARRRARGRGRGASTAWRSVPVRTSRPPITHASSGRSPRIASSRRLQAFPLGRPRRVGADRLVDGHGRLEDPVSAHTGMVRSRHTWQSSPSATRPRGGASVSCGWTATASSGTRRPGRGPGRPRPGRS